MYHMAEALVRWLAPILSFTAEEIWHHLPGDRSESVFLETWYQGLAPMDLASPFDQAFWDDLQVIRESVSKAMEGLRSQEGIGSSLDAEVHLHCSEERFQRLAPIADDLRFIFINSKTQVLKETGGNERGSEIEGLRIEVMPSTHPKCIRCWQHQEDVGSNERHPELCGRCVTNIEGAGESRVLG